MEIKFEDIQNFILHSTLISRKKNYLCVKYLPFTKMVIMNMHNTHARAKKEGEDAGLKRAVKVYFICNGHFLAF